MKVTCTGPRPDATYALRLADHMIYVRAVGQASEQFTYHEVGLTTSITEQSAEAVQGDTTNMPDLPLSVAGLVRVGTFFF